MLGIGGSFLVFILIFCHVAMYCHANDGTLPPNTLPGANLYPSINGNIYPPEPRINNPYGLASYPVGQQGYNVPNSAFQTGGIPMPPMPNFDAHNTSGLQSNQAQYPLNNDIRSPMNGQGEVVAGQSQLGPQNINEGNANANTKGNDSGCWFSSSEGGSSVNSGEISPAGLGVGALAVGAGVGMLAANEMAQNSSMMDPYGTGTMMPGMGMPPLSSGDNLQILGMDFNVFMQMAPYIAASLAPSIQELRLEGEKKNTSEMNDSKSKNETLRDPNENDALRSNLEDMRDGEWWRREQKYIAKLGRIPCRKERFPNPLRENKKDIFTLMPVNGGANEWGYYKVDYGGKTRSGYIFYPYNTNPHWGRYEYVSNYPVPDDEPSQGGAISRAFNKAKAGVKKTFNKAKSLLGFGSKGNNQNSGVSSSGIAYSNSGPGGSGNMGNGFSSPTQGDGSGISSLARNYNNSSGNSYNQGQGYQGNQYGSNYAGNEYGTQQTGYSSYPSRNNLNGQTNGGYSNTQSPQNLGVNRFNANGSPNNYNLEGNNQSSSSQGNQGYSNNNYGSNPQSNGFSAGSSNNPTTGAHASNAQNKSSQKMNGGDASSSSFGGASNTYSSNGANLQEVSNNANKANANSGSANTKTTQQSTSSNAQTEQNKTTHDSPSSTQAGPNTESNTITIPDESKVASTATSSATSPGQTSGAANEEDKKTAANTAQSKGQTNSSNGNGDTINVGGGQDNTSSAASSTTASEKPQEGDSISFS